MNCEMQTMVTEMEDMECIKKTLISWLKEEVSYGKEQFDTVSCGATSDIIKDMAEATKECYEALYYKTVIEAMSEGREPSYGGGSYGYNHRHMANGQFADSGKGHYVRGYNRGPYMDQMPYIDAYIDDPDFEKRMRDHSTMNMGYRPTSRDGEIYDNYHTAKRHYQDSKSTKDKETMEEHGIKYMEHTLGNLKSMWKEADPALKSKMKRDFGDEIAVVLERM